MYEMYWYMINIKERCQPLLLLFDLSRFQFYVPLKLNEFCLNQFI